jgi:hypothetical protein
MQNTDSLDGKCEEKPGRYTGDWLETLDGRTAIARTVRFRVQTLESDLGGEQCLTYSKRSLIRRAIWLELSIEQQELAMGRGEKVETGRLTQSINSLLGILRTLGLERQALEVTCSQGESNAGMDLSRLTDDEFNKLGELLKKAQPI